MEEIIKAIETDDIEFIKKCAHLFDEHAFLKLEEIALSNGSLLCFEKLQEFRANILSESSETSKNDGISISFSEVIQKELEKGDIQPKQLECIHGFTQGHQLYSTCRGAPGGPCRWWCINGGGNEWCKG